MTTKFVTTYSKLGLNGQNFGEEHAFWQWNYMGVVFRLPVASPGHRLMETHHVH